jgi:2EXR family
MESTFFMTKKIPSVVSAHPLLLQGTPLTLEVVTNITSSTIATSETDSLPNSPNSNSPVASPIATRDYTFHLFPKLPLEIRRMIWKDSLPHGRRVCLSTPLHLHDKITQQKYPTALHVNRESRQMALDHYLILSHYAESRFLWTSFAVLPLCFDPALDYLHISVTDTFYSDLEDIAQRLLEKSPGLFRKVTKLEINIMKCGLHSWWTWRSGWTHGVLALQHGREIGISMLKYFQKLRSVELRASNWSHGSDPEYFPWTVSQEREGYRM